jgi:hypothetical protein
MSVAKTEAALQSASPEPILCWCYGQSLESRYSNRGGAAGAAAGGGVAGLVGASIARSIMNRRLARVRADNAVLLPPTMVVALSASGVFLLSRRALDDGPVAALNRHQVHAAHSGHVWHRLDLTVTNGGGPRVYTIMAFGPGSGPRRFRQVIEELARSGAPALR